MTDSNGFWAAAGKISVGASILAFAGITIFTPRSVWEICCSAPSSGAAPVPPRDIVDKPKDGGEYRPSPVPAPTSPPPSIAQAQPSSSGKVALLAQHKPVPTAPQTAPLSPPLHYGWNYPSRYSEGELTLVAQHGDGHVDLIVYSPSFEQRRVGIQRGFHYGRLMIEPRGRIYGWIMGRPDNGCADVSFPVEGAIDSLRTRIRLNGEVAPVDEFCRRVASAGQEYRIRLADADTSGR